MIYDCHTHPLGHEGGRYTVDRLKPFVEQGIAQGLGGIGFTDHEWYVNDIDPEIVHELQKQYPDFKLLLGLEVDYAPDREEELRRIIEEKPYDYIIGSVHDLGSWPFDHPDYQGEYEKWDNNVLYESYFALLDQAVSSGLFQLVGHLDLIKVFGYRYKGDILALAKPVLVKIKKQGMAIELNTNGLNKPVQEMYPEVSILKEAFALRIPVALSSDAHEEWQVGRDFAQARQLLREIGYRQLAHFKEKAIVLGKF